MPHIVNAEAVRFNNDILLRRKCDTCNSYYFFCLEELKYDKFNICEICDPFWNKESEKSVRNGVRITKSRCEAVLDYKIARRSTRNYRAVFRRDNFICQYCMDAGDTIDHINPVSFTGSNKLENLVCCCRECNCLASNIIFNSFYDKMNYILSKKRY
jgi:5-methylcytosine-specific restriction endonuclease McrA